MDIAPPRLYGKLVLMAVFWAGAFPATRILLEGMGVLTATFVRFWWAALAYLVPFATVLPFIWFWQGVHAIGAARASQFINLCPPVAVAKSIVLLGEPFTPALLVGTVLVVAGLYLTNRASRAPETPAA